MSALSPQAQYPSFKFAVPGDKFKGVVTQPPLDRQARDFTTQKPKTWPDGNPVMQTRIVARLTDGNEYAIYAQGRMAKAITKALGAGGAKDIEVGGQIEVEFSHTEPSKGGGQPAKEYKASYVPPAAGQFDDDEPPF